MQCKRSKSPCSLTDTIWYIFGNLVKSVTFSIFVGFLVKIFGLFSGFGGVFLIGWLCFLGTGAGGGGVEQK